MINVMIDPRINYHLSFSSDHASGLLRWKHDEINCNSMGRTPRVFMRRVEFISRGQFMKDKMTRMKRAGSIDGSEAGCHSIDPGTCAPFDTKINRIMVGIQTLNSGLFQELTHIHEDCSVSIGFKSLDEQIKHI